jgi:hypothetical protein
MRIAAYGQSGSYRSYLVARLGRSLHLAEAAASDQDRATHLRACRYYCDLLDAGRLE